MNCTFPDWDLNDVIADACIIKARANSMAFPKWDHGMEKLGCSHST